MKNKNILFYTLSTDIGGGVEIAAIEYLNQYILEGYNVDLLVDYNMVDV